MAIIQHALKWDLNDNAWRNPIDNEIKRSFAIAANIDGIENPTLHKDEMINYVIVSLGSRVEDHYLDHDNIKDNSFNVDKMREYFDSRDHNTIIRYVMLDADAPLIEDAKLISNYVDSIADNSNVATINLVGLSKGGMINMYIPHFYNLESSYKKTYVYNIATPYSGTLLASPLIFYPEVKKLVVNKFGDNRASEIVYKSLINFYESICSNSHMDYDIAMPGGVSLDKSYDPNFVKNALSDENIEAIKKTNGFHNFITGISDGVLSTAVKNWDYMAIGLCILDKWFFEEKSDGFVKSNDQFLIENFIDVESVKLNSSHVFFNNSELYKLLDCIYANIDKTEQRIRKL